MLEEDGTLQNHKKNESPYVDIVIKLFAKNEKELETLIQTIRICSQVIGMEYGIEKCVMLKMKMRIKETT